MQEANVNYIKYLIGLSRRGRKNSYIELCELNLQTIYTLCARTLGDKKIAAEVTKDTFISAWQNIQFVREDISVSVWLSSIAVYEILEELRNRKRRRTIYPEYKNNDQKTYEPVETDVYFEKLILDLPELERVIFVLHDIEGYSEKDVTDFFDDLTKEEVKRILKLARETLKEQIRL